MLQKPGAAVDHPAGVAAARGDELFRDICPRGNVHPQTQHGVLIDHAHQVVAQVAPLLGAGLQDVGLPILVHGESGLSAGGGLVEIKCL